MNSALFFILILYIAFRLKQLFCDFILQTGWMALHKGDPGMAGYKPLAAHAGIHAIGTLIIMLVLAPHFWWLAIVDFVAHGAVDRLKAMVTAYYKLDISQSRFWWAIGLDQEAHNFTHLAYIVFIVMGTAGL